MVRVLVNLRFQPLHHWILWKMVTLARRFGLKPHWFRYLSIPTYSRLFFLPKSIEKQLLHLYHSDLDCRNFHHFVLTLQSLNPYFHLTGHNLNSSFALYLLLALVTLAHQFHEVLKFLSYLRSAFPHFQIARLWVILSLSQNLANSAKPIRFKLFDLESHFGRFHFQRSRRLHQRPFPWCRFHRNIHYHFPHLRCWSFLYYLEFEVSFDTAKTAEYHSRSDQQI